MSLIILKCSKIHNYPSGIELQIKNICSSTAIFTNAWHLLTYKRCIINLVHVHTFTLHCNSASWGVKFVFNFSPAAPTFRPKQPHHPINPWSRTRSFFHSLCFPIVFFFCFTRCIKITLQTALKAAVKTRNELRDRAVCNRAKDRFPVPTHCARRAENKPGAWEKG